MKLKAVYFYLILAAWTALLAIVLKAGLNVTGLGVILAFLTMIFTPGILLCSLIGINSENLAVKILYTIGLGFGFYFLFNLAAIFLNLTINQLIWLIAVAVIVLFLSSFYKDRQKQLTFDFSLWFKDKSLGDWLFIFIVLLAGLVAFLVIDAQSDKLLGDGWFHLAILQKITSGDGLNPYNLWVTKTTVLNPVYSFPVWHIFVGVLAKILDIPIFTALRQVLLPLVILSMITWYAFSFLIFKNRYLASCAFLAFLLVFLKDNSFYYLVALTSPDSFNRLLLMPLLLGLSVSFIFVFSQSNSKIFNVALIALLAIFMGLIHFTQLIYFVLILILLLVILLAMKKKEETLKALMLLLGLAVLTGPYLLIFQRQALAGFLSGNVQADPENLTFKTYLGANIIYRYAILSLPVIILFAKKNARLLILLAIALGALLIYWPFLGLQPIFLKYLGDIFVSRSIASIPHFLYFGFLLFLVAWGLSHLFARNRYLNPAAAVIFGFLTLTALVFPGIYRGFVEKYIFSETFALFTGGFWILFGLAIIISLIIYFSKKEVVISLPENKLGFAVLTIFLIVFLATPYFDGVKKVLAKNPNGSILSNRLTTNASDIAYFGGEKTIDFWQENSRKVYLTDAVTLSQMILLYSNNLAAEYPYGIKEFTQTPKFYDENLSLQKKLALLDQWQADYVVVRHTGGLAFYKNHPQNFRLVFENHYFWQKNRDLYIFAYLR